MKKLTIGDMMGYWGIEGVKKSIGSVGIQNKYEAIKGSQIGLGRTPLEATHTLVSAIKAAKA